MAEPATTLPSIPSRPDDAHKGDMGRVFLIAGSRGMAGAAVLAAGAALRGGAGYAVVGCPGSIAPEMTAAVPEALLCLCGDSSRSELRPSDASVLLSESRSSQSLVIGPGLGDESSVGDLLLNIIPPEGGSAPMVLDADALNHLARGERLITLTSNAILTPHPGEAARLLTWDSADAVQQNREEALERLVEKFRSVVILKGHRTLVGAPSLGTWVNTTGNPGMATAGSGDVLSGLLGAFLARGLSTWDAARLAAYLHGLAGDIASGRVGKESLCASDILETLPQAIQKHQ